MTEENQGQPSEQVQQDAVLGQAEQVAVVEQAYADLGQHGHAAAQLENPDHANPHEAGNEEFQQ